MTETTPILWVESQPHDNQKRRVSGRAPEPIVPVTRDLRDQLELDLRAAASTPNIPEGLERAGLPLVTRVRPEARAKSKRPYTLLGNHSLAPVAAGGDKELVSQATPSTIEELSRTVRTSTRRTDESGISSVESFRLWNPNLDALPPGTPSMEDLVKQAQDANTSLQLVFFPWVTPETEYEQGRSVSEALTNSGFVVEGVTGSESSRPALFVRPTAGASSYELSRLFGLRAASLTPTYKALDEIEAQYIRTLGTEALISIPDSGLPAARVGVLDSGIDSNTLSPWIMGRIQYSAGSDLDPSHGTFVAGLIVAGSQFNTGNPTVPIDSARVLDAQVLPSTPIASYELFERIREVVSDWAPKGVSVWNCSFAMQEQLEPLAYSELAQQLDELAEEFDVLFVQAVGNSNTDRPWPPDPTTDYGDSIASPSESVRGLGVGALSGIDGAFTPNGCPASYTRRGPSFGGMMKPDVTQFGGEWSDVTPLDLQGHGIRSVGSSDRLAESLGTSFATPLVSAVAANTWALIETSPARQPASPSLVKGLIVHSAALESQVDEDERRYRGAGVPGSSSAILEETEDTFTTVHKAVLTNGVDWWKDPFPIPECLITPDGKLQAEVVVTLCFSPLIDPAFDEECVRTSVDVSWGPVVDGVEGPTINGLVPLEAGYRWESDRVEAGKWSPIKTHRSRFPRGKAGARRIGMKLSMLERMPGEHANTQIEAFVIVSLRGIHPGLPVHSDGVNRLRELQYVSNPLTSSVPVRVRA